MDKKQLSERDICTKFITPNLVAADDPGDPDELLADYRKLL